MAMAHNFETQINISGGGGSLSQAGGLRHLSRPFVVLSHVTFRGAAVVFYVFANLLISSFIIQFLVLLTLHSLDLWTVKNVTGRLLTGLRWWNFVDAEGKNHWRFEVSKNPEQYQQLEKQLFWGTLVAAPLLWVLLVLSSFFTFQWSWMVVAGIGATMTLTNLYGYLRCKWSSTAELTNYLTKWAFFSMLKRQQDQQPTSLVQQATTAEIV